MSGRGVGRLRCVEESVPVGQTEDNGAKATESEPDDGFGKDVGGVDGGSDVSYFVSSIHWRGDRRMRRRRG